MEEEEEEEVLKLDVTFWGEVMRIAWLYYIPLRQEPSDGI